MSSRTSSNDMTILNQTIESRRQEVASSMSPADYFTFFTVEQLLKDYGLAPDELEAGIVDGGGDGGIDAAYVFLDDRLCQDAGGAVDPKVRRNPSLDLVVVQSKMTPSFAEQPMDRLLAAANDLLDLSKDFAQCKTVYNERVLDVFEIFRDVHAKVVGRFPNVRFRFYYVSCGDKPHPNVKRKVRPLTDRLTQLYSASKSGFEFVGARELLDYARKAPPSSYSLQLAEGPISSAGAVGYVCLVDLTTYHQFITQSGGLNSHLFEANVRDYQGSTEVNKQIAATLTGSPDVEFWWLNNGVTIVATSASHSAKTLTIENPRVVNGLQTSYEIFEYLKSGSKPATERRLLVRVVVPGTEEHTDQIIRATNSQTPIQAATLRATDRVQRNIEDYLRKHDLYYDRRKNYYRNEGKPKDRIISISYLAQCVMAVLLQKPDTARARPSSLLRDDSDYNRAFASSHPLAMYRACLSITRAAESYVAAAGLPKDARANLRFHVAMYLAVLMTHRRVPNAADIAGLVERLPTPEEGSSAVVAVVAEYMKLGASDIVAKGPDLSRSVLKAAWRAVKEALRTDADILAEGAKQPAP